MDSVESLIYIEMGQEILWSDSFAILFINMIVDEHFIEDFVCALLARKSKCFDPFCSFLNKKRISTVKYTNSVLLLKHF